MKNYELIKRTIKEGIKEGIDFEELRKRLPDIRKRPLMSLVFDVMHEIGTDQIPFPGMVLRPRLTRKPIPIEEDGTLNIWSLLEEKGFETKKCEARCHIGNDKITLTVRPVKPLYKDPFDCNNRIDESDRIQNNIIYLEMDDTSCIETSDIHEFGAY